MVDDLTMMEFSRYERRRVMPRREPLALMGMLFLIAPAFAQGPTGIPGVVAPGVIPELVRG